MSDVATDGLDEGSRKTLLRAASAADLEWVVEMHAAIYGTEYGYDGSFVGLVRELTQAFSQRPWSSGHRGWIATDSQGKRLGSVFLTESADDPKVGKLRLLVLDAAARGRGVGKQLVVTCIQAARAHGYEAMVLETERELTAARALYAAQGFRCVERQPHCDWGREDLEGEIWRLDFESKPLV